MKQPKEAVFGKENMHELSEQNTYGWQNSSPTWLLIESGLTLIKSAQFPQLVGLTGGGEPNMRLSSSLTKWAEAPKKKVKWKQIMNLD